MSHYHPTASSSSNFQLIINNALKAYEKRTKEDLLAHPLAAQLQACNSPSFSSKSSQISPYLAMIDGPSGSIRL
jgi:hypothetical protein